MDRLHFSRRAQRRVRRRRVLSWLAAASIAASLAGLPGPTLGVGLLEDMFARHINREDTVRTSSSTESMLRFRAEVFESRPAPSPSATPVGSPPAPEGSIAEVVYAAAAEFGLDAGYLLAIAECESGLDPSAYNPAGYHGLFQFDSQTWAAYGYGSINDPVAQARTAARLIAAGQSSRWPVCA